MFKRRRKFSKEFWRLHWSHLRRQWAVLGLTLLGTGAVAGVSFYRYSFDEWAGIALIAVYLGAIFILLHNFVRWPSLPTFLTVIVVAVPAGLSLVDRFPIGAGFVCAAASVIFLLTFVFLPSALLDGLRVRVVPYFEKQVTGRSTFLKGKALIWNSASLDRIAEEMGLAPLSSFSSGDDLLVNYGEVFVWHNPEPALKIVSRLLAELRNRPDIVEDSEQVLVDLEALRNRLSHARAENVRFCLLIREGSTCSGQEMDVRKGDF